MHGILNVDLQTDLGVFAAGLPIEIVDGTGDTFTVRLVGVGEHTVVVPKVAVSLDEHGQMRVVKCSDCPAETIRGRRFGRCARCAAIYARQRRGLRSVS